MHDSAFLKALYVDYDYDMLMSKYASDKECMALTMLMQCNFLKAAELYNELGMSFEEGYCYLLNGDLYKVEEIWDSLGDESSWLLWGRSLLQILQGELKDLPTYMQLRNFLEVELNVFFKCKRYNFIDKIIKSLDTLVEINPECYKYIGRCFLNDNQPREALGYLAKFCEINFNDPEIQYLLAKCYMKLRLVGLAQAAISRCLAVTPNYYPAKMFFSEENKNGDV